MLNEARAGVDAVDERFLAWTQNQVNFFLIPLLLFYPLFMTMVSQLTKASLASVPSVKLKCVLFSNLMDNPFDDINLYYAYAVFVL